MSYSHAEANLMAISALRQETAQLLRALAETDPERARQLCEEAYETSRDPQ
jgi:DNA-binding GntR family transcriptional regulator